MKKFLIITLLFVAFALPVFAEQPAAEQYRQMFSSGNFYLEYEVADISGYWGYDSPSPRKKIFTASLHSNFNFGMPAYDKKKQHIIRAGRYGQRITKVGLEDKYPRAFYRDGKYYRFTKTEEESSNIFFGASKQILRNAYVLDEEKIYSPNLDPDDKWQNVRDDLALPEVFCVLFPNDPMNDYAQLLPKPIFNGSFKRTIEDKEYDCDQYINDIKSMAGTVIAQEAYNILYDSNKLVRVQKYLLRDGKEFLITDLIIHNVNSQVPDETFVIHKKFKLYAARNGDMNDLLDNLKQIGEIGGSVQ